MMWMHENVERLSSGGSYLDIVDLERAYGEYGCVHLKMGTVQSLATGVFERVRKCIGTQSRYLW